MPTTMSRRALLRAAGGIGAAAMLPWAQACDADDQSLSFFFQANPEEAEGRAKIIDAFRRTHPDIPVRTVLSGPDPMQQMSTFCSGGKCPDVLMAWELTYAGLAERGVLLDLNTMLRRDPTFARELAGDSIDAMYETFAYRGGQYAFPEQWSGSFLFYNSKLFAEAKVESPPTSWDQTWPFDEFLSAAQALTRRDGSGKVTRWGFVDTCVTYYSAGLFGVNNGAQWCTPRTNPTHLNVNDPAFIDGVQFYADLANKYRVAPTPADEKDVSTPDMFTSGAAAMAMGGHWRWSTFSEAEDIEIDVTVLPSGRPGIPARSNIGTTGLAIAADTPRRDQAWEFVKFMTGPEGQRLIAESGLYVPVLESALHSSEFAKTHTGVRNLAVLTGGPAHSTDFPVTPAWEKIDALLDSNIGPVLRGARPATTLAGTLSRDIDEVLHNP